MEQIDGGWRVKETDTHYVDVLSMAFNDRIVHTPKDSPITYDRYWCYDKGGAALHAAVLWDGSLETEPVGWKKASGERYPDTVHALVIPQKGLPQVLPLGHGDGAVAAAYGLLGGALVPLPSRHEGVAVFTSTDAKGVRAPVTRDALDALALDWSRIDGPVEGVVVAVGVDAEDRWVSVPQDIAASVVPDALVPPRM